MRTSCKVKRRVVYVPCQCYKHYILENFISYTVSASYRHVNIVNIQKISKIRILKMKRSSIVAILNYVLEIKDMHKIKTMISA